MPSADGTLPEEGSPWITRSYYYDKLGRVIQTTESDNPGWAARYSTEYDFAGRVVAKMESHCAPDDQSWHSLLTQYSYDDRGRLLSIGREVDGMVLADVNCSYDALGHLTGKAFGNAMDSGYGTQSFDYDIHGWVTDIEARDNLGEDLVFKEVLRYASTQKPGTAARWDGNIAEAAFTDPDGSHTYAYIYDGMGRLTDAKHYAGDSNTVSSQRTEKNISYNRNGCITGLDRYGAEGLSESVIFGHTGNRLSSLSSWNGAGLLENGHFTYDAMGNMLTDSRNGLEFSYNLANLPESVEGADGASLTYSYLSDGSKWRASASEGPSILYRGSFVYEDDGTSSRISSIAWDEGRISYHYASAIDSLAVVDSLEVELGEIVVVDTMAVDIVEDGICDEWHVRDHLGSVRAIAGIGNYITGVRELNTYLPFGTRIPGSIQATDNRHRFGGKEEQRYGSFSLDLSDFGARYYDPFTCRWTTRDPMAETTVNIVPYSYCLNNPVLYYDPFGLSTYKVGDQTYIINDGDPNFRMDVSQKQYDKLSRKFERNVLRYARYRNRLSKKNGFTNTETINSGDGAFSLNASVITYHAPGSESYMEYQKISFMTSSINALLSSATSKPILNRINFGSNQSLYLMHNNGRIFNGNQYVSVINLWEQYGNMVKCIDVTNTLIAGLSTLHLSQRMDPVSRKLFLASEATGAVVAKTASLLLTPLGISTGTILGPGGAVAGGLIGNIAGSAIGDLTKTIISGNY